MLDHKLRAKGIGSSEIAMLVIGEDGQPLSKWGGPHKLWRIKTGVDLPQDDKMKPWLSRGHALEPWILDRYAELTGSKLRRSPGTRQHKQYPYVVDSVDALAWAPGDGKNPTRAVEAKAPIVFTFWEEFGDEGTDEVPKQYAVQGQWHCGAWGLEFCDYPIDTSTGDIKIFTTTHDEETWMALLQVAEKFWTDHVVANKAPPVDAKEETSQWLSKRLKQKDQDIVDADDDIAKKLLEYRSKKLAAKISESELELLENQIKEAIGEHKGICVPNQPKLRVAFGMSKGRASFDLDSFCDEVAKLLPKDVELPARDDYKKRGESYRKFYTNSLLKNEPGGGSK